MKQQFMIKTSFAAMLLAIVGSASAASNTASLNVTATVATNCTINTAAVAFTPYDTVAGTAVNATGTVSIACTKNTSPNITLGLGANASGTTRQMSDGSGGLLSYELYQPTANTVGAGCNYTGATIWNMSNIFSPTAAPSKASRSYSVCGQINAGQDVVAGSYADTVVATVNF